VDLEWVATFFSLFFAWGIFSPYLSIVLMIADVFLLFSAFLGALLPLILPPIANELFTQVCLHVRDLIFLTDFDQNFKVPANYNKNLQHFLKILHVRDLHFFA